LRKAACWQLAAVQSAAKLRHGDALGLAQLQALLNQYCVAVA